MLAVLSNGSLQQADTHCYNAVLGLPELRQLIAADATRRGLNMQGQEVMVCAGANQAIVNAALALLDAGDSVSTTLMITKTRYNFACYRAETRLSTTRAISHRC
jgi:aspartate/methionine/tyrosine aminotransferase